MLNTAATPKGKPRKHSWLTGFSLTEMMVTITTIGVMAGIVVSQIGGTHETAKEQLAKEKLKMVNDAVYKHQLANSRDNLESLTPSRSASWDELKVLQQLQYRDPSNPAPGSPFLDPKYRPPMSSSTRDYRMEWTGGLFKLIPPGQTGSGAKVVFDGSDIGTPYVFPPGYKWSGR